MRFRVAAAVLAILALVPVSARAEETLTASTDTASVTTPTSLVTGPVVDLASQVRALDLIAQRVHRLPSSSVAAALAMNEDGTPLWGTHPTASLMPASTMKVVTAVVALELIGANVRPKTSVDFDTATGRLTLVGGGDPQLTSAQLGRLADATVESLTAMGLVPSQLSIDDSLFAAPTVQAGVFATQLPTEERPVRALVVDQKRTMDSGIDAGKVFRRLLAERGVLVPFSGRLASQGTHLASVSGYTMRSSLQEMLWYSDNDIAEMAFRLSAVAAGRKGTWADARTTAAETLRRLGVPMSGVTVVDGAGLSRNNRLTPAAIAQMLRAAATNPRTSILPEILPAAGINGTLKTRYAKSPASCVRGALKAKTGTLYDVIALAGYAPTSGIGVRPFAIIMNRVQHSESAHLQARAAIDALAAAISGC